MHHSFEYKSPESFSNKEVVCIGIGESGSDVVHQISKVADKTHLIVNRPKSIISRMIFGDTGDSRTTRAAHYSFLVNQSLFEASLKKRVVARGIRTNENRKHRDLSSIWMWKYLVKYGLHGEFTNKNDVFFQDIDAGRLALHLFGLREIVEDGVILGDGTKILCSDIVLSTGYKTKFDMLDHHAAREVESNVRSAYFHMIHPSLRESLVWIGFVRPDVGGVPAIAELQARLFSALLSKRVSLPNDKELRSLIAEHRKKDEFYFNLEKDKSENVKYYKFTKNLAKVIDVDIRPLRLFLKNPKLFFYCFHGSMVGAQFRLFGYGSNYQSSKKFIYKVGITKAPLSHLLFFVPLGSVLSIVAPVFRAAVNLFGIQDIDLTKKFSNGTVREILSNEWPGGKNITIESNHSSLRSLFRTSYEWEGFRYLLSTRYEISPGTSSKDITISEINDLIKLKHSRLYEAESH